ncbi:MAG: ComF family protein [Candidatus Marinimicrobia bacterium]|nr:ComF family protein [Candidatus Neomarinimicrobiota bacterium]
MRREHPADYVACMYYFDPLIQKLVHLLKYRDMPFVGECLGERIGTCFRDKPPAECDILLPVPLHPQRRRERGYNQSACIARGIAKIWKVPMETRLLKRCRNTRSQTKLNREERRENIRGAFQLRKSAKVPERICIVDDVFTTGATTLEIAGLLRKSGAKQLSILTLATPVKDQ